MRLTAARLAAALVVLHTPCALLDAAEAGRRGADEGTCAAGACGAAQRGGAFCSRGGRRRLR